MYLIFDTETTGLPRDYNAPATDTDNWPRVVQLAWVVCDDTGSEITSGDFIIRPDGFTIPFNSEKVHGISTRKAQELGVPLLEALEAFERAVGISRVVVGHNLDFDVKVVGSEYARLRRKAPLEGLHPVDTKDESTEYCAIPGGFGGRYKWPTLEELHRKLFNTTFAGAHDALADVRATARCFLELVRLQVVRPDVSGLVDPDRPLSERVLRSAIEESLGKEKRRLEPAAPESGNGDEPETNSQGSALSASDPSPDPGPAPASPAPAPVSATPPAPLPEKGFVHLHTHSQYSILRSPARIEDLVAAAKEDGADAVALTDLGNMFGAFHFVKAAKQAGLKPILGCECYMVADRRKQRFTRENRDYRILQPLLARNAAGYRNLSRLVSLGYIEGYYDRYPRVDRELLARHAEGLIALTGGLRGEIADLILNRGDGPAEEAFLWWKKTFGPHFMVTLQRHGLEEEDRVNDVLLQFARRHDVPVLAANDVYYVGREDWKAHDALLCIDDGVPLSMPVGKGRGFRFGFPNREFYYKSTREMAELFRDLPEALSNVASVVEQIEAVELEQEIMLPNFTLPEGFDDADAYLRHLTLRGAKDRYPEPPPELEARIDRELGIIADMGFAGYFLIVQDFIAAAKRMGVFVGPGRGSAAGSVAAYCIGITNVDPLRYELLFERFLNPERVSMPDMDIDFDDDGRQKVIDYVVDKYGANQVAHIITFGTLAARSSVRDVGRVLEFPLPETDKLAKKVPETVGMTLKRAYEEVPELRGIRSEDSLAGQTLQLAETLEGSVRNTGIHAAGVIIAPEDLLGLIPVATTRDSDLWVTQFDGKVIESAGMLKMDFLGLKTLSILKTVLEMVRLNHGKAIDLDGIPLDDPATFELYQAGGTVGSFQFESEGMRKHLRNLKPTDIEDLIAMNALYRPGPMQFIPDYIRRKHGQESVAYPHEDLRDILEPTYGIMIYQEQIMKVAQRMADYSLGEADILRRIMGKKKPELMALEEEKFMQRALAKGYGKAVAKDVFDKMALFAGYGFNKSHSAAYSVLAYQTMYFKANYPAEYMAAVLSHNMSDLKKVTFFIEECRSMGLQVDSPNINTGISRFSVTGGRIQFGLSAIKGVGSGAIESIVQEREENGPFRSVFDFTGRVDSKLCNRRAMESLIQAGAFDVLHENRAQLLAGLDEVMQFGQRRQEEVRRNQTSLFDVSAAAGAPLIEPRLRELHPWSTMERLRREREVIGFYLSGHPLDRYREEIDLFSTLRKDLHAAATEPEPKDSRRWGRQQDAHRPAVSVLGIVTGVRRHMDSRKRPIAFLQLEDAEGGMEVCVFSEEFDRYGGLLEPDTILYVEGVVRPREELQLVAQMIERAENIRHRFQDRLLVQLAIETQRIPNGMLAEIAALFATHKGRSPVELLLQSPSMDTPMVLLARKFRVEPTRELIEKLRGLLGSVHVMLVNRESRHAPREGAVGAGRRANAPSS